MSDPAVEFVRCVPLARLASEPFHQTIAANDSERAALARRFDLVSLDRLIADVELVREPTGTILLSATFEADFAQVCIVTLDRIAGSVAERFELRYGAPEAEVSAGVDDPAFEPLQGEAIDIAEAVAQEFSLALPLFPRAPDAVVDTASPEASEDGPFAVLAWLGRPKPQ
jgi:uncharacterized metal-binding protein YceD (DUF177 family)